MAACPLMLLGKTVEILAKKGIHIRKWLLEVSREPLIFVPICKV